MEQGLAKALIAIGLLISAIGVVLLVVGRFVRLGHLPGDIRIERPGGSFFFPITTSIIVSIVLTVLLNLLIRLMRR